MTGRAKFRLLVFGLSIAGVIGPKLGVSAQDISTAPKLSVVTIPPERSLPIPPASSILSPDSVVLQRISEAHTGSRLAQMDFLGEGTVMVQTDDGPLSFGVTILRNGFRAQNIQLKQRAGKLANVGLGSLDPIARRVVDFLQTQYERGLAGLLQSAERNAVVRDGGINDGAQALAVLEADGNPTRYLVDAEASRVMRFEFRRGRTPDASGRPVPTLESYVFSDFRNVTGLATPFKVEHYINGTKQEELQFASVRYVPANRDTAPGPIRGGLRR